MSQSCNNLKGFTTAEARDCKKHVLFVIAYYLAYCGYHVNVEYSDLEASILVGCSSDFEAVLSTTLKLLSKLYCFEYKKNNYWLMSDKQTCAFKICF